MGLKVEEDVLFGDESVLCFIWRSRSPCIESETRACKEKYVRGSVILAPSV